MARAASSDIRFYAGSHTNLVATFASTGAATFAGAVTASGSGTIGGVFNGAGSGSTNNVSIGTSGGGAVFVQGYNAAFNTGQTLGLNTAGGAVNVGTASTVTTINGTTAGASNAGALVVAGGISAGNTGSAASYFGGAVTIGGSANLSIQSGAGLFLDGGSNTYIVENVADSVQVKAGGLTALTATSALTTVNGNLTVSGTGTSTFAGDVSVTRTGGAREVRIATTTSGAAGFYAQGYSSATTITGTAGGELVLYNQDSTANTFGAVTNLDAAGNTTSRIRFINESDANNTGSIAFATRPSGGSLTDALTLASTGAATFAGAVTTSSTTLSGAGAIPITTSLVKFTSTGVADALTLANGVDGQRLTIVHDVKGTLGTGVLTPTTKTGFSTVTFTNAGDTVSLVYVTTRGWMVTGSYLATIAP